MPKKKVAKHMRRTHKKSSGSIPAFFVFRRVIIIPLVLLFLGFLAFTQTQTWHFFITGKEQFFPNDPTKTAGYFHGREVQVPKLLAYDPQEEDRNVLGDTSNKRIEIDLTNQHVYAYEGDNRVYDFTVSTGKWGATPKGEFTIERRVRVQTMSGGSRALGTYYYLPNVEFVQFFGNRQIPWWRGFSFHSTYWHNNFGHPMSHGCINMKREDAETLWNWAAQGTRVIIYGTTPPS